MYWNKIIPELSVTNLENSLKFYRTLGFNLEYDRPENNLLFLVQDPDGYLLRFFQDLGEKASDN